MVGGRRMARDHKSGAVRLVAATPVGSVILWLLAAGCAGHGGLAPD